MQPGFNFDSGFSGSPFSSLATWGHYGNGTSESDMRVASPIRRTLSRTRFRPQFSDTGHSHRVHSAFSSVNQLLQGHNTRFLAETNILRRSLRHTDHALDKLEAATASIIEPLNTILAIHEKVAEVKKQAEEKEDAPADNPPPFGMYL